MHVSIRALVAVFGLFSATVSAAEKQPNIVFFVLDDLCDWVGPLGYKQAKTPNMDRLASSGVTFTNAHTAGIFCAPSRSALFTGRHASTTGCYTTQVYHRDHPSLQPLQAVLRDGGYTTHGGGKLFHHPAGYADLRGWDNFFVRDKQQKKRGWALESWSFDMDFLPKPFPYSPFSQDRELNLGLFLEWGPIQNENEGKMADTIRTDWACELLRQKHDKPLFLAVGLYTPHFPNYAPQKYFDLYDPKKIKLPSYNDKDLNDLPPAIRKKKTARAAHHKRLVELDAVENAIHGYLACVSYADAMLGRVLNAIAEGPNADNTVVILLSDHGYHHGEKFDWGKHTLWERTSNVPLIIAGPDIAKNTKIDTTVSLIDLFPSVTGMAQVEDQQNRDGVSLVQALKAPAGARDRNVLLPGMKPNEYALMNRNWRYIHYADGGDELYQVQQDPNEWHNLAGTAKHAKVIKEMRQSAPKKFASPGPAKNELKLVTEGENFRWEKRITKPLKKPNRINQGTPKSGGRKKKNILLIVCDDLNTHVSPAGYKPIITPHMTQLASEAMTFNRAFCQYPVCGPSRASFLSGLYPESTGVLDNKKDIRITRPGTLTMPGFFKKNGYWTASAGKVFHSPKHEQGDDVWNEFVRFQNDELPIVRAAREKFEAEFGSVNDAKNRKRWKAVEKAAKSKLDAQTPPGYGRSGLTDEQHKDGKNARQVASWLTKKAHGSKPFFITCGIQKPHVPFLAPDKYFNLYPLDAIRYTPDRPDLWDSLPRKAINTRFKEFGFELGKENDALRREYMQAYHACVSFIDVQIGLIIAALKESGHWEDTIVILTSDHGYHLGDHFLWGKVTLFDVGTKVPFIIRAPGLTHGATHSEAMVELVDIYPTLTSLTELEAPNHLQGMSLQALLKHPDRLGRKKYAYSIVTRGKQLGYALRNQRWRYGKWPDGEELYRLTHDPDEKRNLASKPAHAERLRTFRTALTAKRKQAGQKRNKQASPQSSPNSVPH